VAAVGDFVLVEVGSEKPQLRIYKSLLTHHSEYFQKALNGPWKEASERVVKLEYFECSVFDISVNRIYAKTLPKHSDE
jgi:hypothetical protein